MLESGVFMINEIKMLAKNSQDDEDQQGPNYHATSEGNTFISTDWYHHGCTALRKPSYFQEEWSGPIWIPKTEAELFKGTDLIISS